MTKTKNTILFIIILVVIITAFTKSVIDKNQLLTDIDNAKTEGHNTNVEYCLKEENISTPYCISFIEENLTK